MIRTPNISKRRLKTLVDSQNMCNSCLVGVWVNYIFIHSYSILSPDKDASRSGRTTVGTIRLGTKTVLFHINMAGYKKKSRYIGTTWVNAKNLIEKISICESLLNRKKIDIFLKRKEKWVTYDNAKRPYSRFRSVLSTIRPSEISDRPEVTSQWPNGEEFCFSRTMPDHIHR